MRLYLVIDHERWGRSYNIVRAESFDQAAKFAGVTLKHTAVRVDAKDLSLTDWREVAINGLEVWKDGPRSTYIAELTPDGAPGLLWVDDDSPDSVRECECYDE